MRVVFQRIGWQPTPCGRLSTVAWGSSRTYVPTGSTAVPLGALWGTNSLSKGVARRLLSL